MTPTGSAMLDRRHRPCQADDDASSITSQRCNLDTTSTLKGQVRLNTQRGSRPQNDPDNSHGTLTTSNSSSGDSELFPSLSTIRNATST